MFPKRAAKYAFAAVLIAALIVASPIFYTALRGPEGAAGPRGRDGAGGGGGGGGIGADGEDGYTALIAVFDEGAGANCPDGGERVESGPDNGEGGGTPRNGILESGEVTEIFYTCDGATGYNSVVDVQLESPGVNCPDGGQKIFWGLDNGDGGGTAGDNVLSVGERDGGPKYTCDGADGAPGTSGANGFNSIVKMTVEPPGGNCPEGGQQFESGLDNGDGGGTPNNGILEAGERDVGPLWICDGADGAAGATGPAGRDPGLKYTYSTGTSGDPGSGKFGFDTVTLSAIATLRVSETDGDGNALAELIATWDDSTTTSARSTITMLGDGTPTRLLVFRITSAITDNGAYDSFSVSYITSSGVHANNDLDKIFESRTGDQGTAGSNGAAGRDAGLKYTYSTGTSGDPGSGKFGFDTTTLASIATLRISETDGDSNGIAAFIATWDDSTTTGTRSTITILGDGAPARLLVFTITSAITDNGAYDSFSVAHVSNSGSWANNDVDKLFQSRTGDLGATGAAGSNGAGFSVTKALSSAATTTSTTGTEVTGLNSGSLSSGIYVATFYILCRAAATTTGIDFGINFDSTQDLIVSQMSYQDTGTTATTGNADGTVSGDGAELIIAGGSVITETTTAPNLNVITGVASTTEDFLVIIVVIFKPTATGELELWFATDVSTSQVDVRIGSSVTIIKTG